MPESSTHFSRPTVSAKPSILVVDDERIIRELCAQALRNYRVLQAATCEEALRIYEHEQIDLVLSDIMMPGGSGIDLLRQVKTYDPNATVIVMTGFVDKDIILNALKEDADDFINKPLNLLQLKTAIEKALARKTLKEELANIKRSDELKNAFLSIVSHKLRTPITGISLFLQNLQVGALDPEDPYFTKSVALVSEEAKYLGQLVADLLTFSQVMVSDNQVTRSECAITDIVADVLMKCRELHGNYDGEIDAEVSSVPLLLLDEAKIRFALLQVVDNAFKFSGKQGHVSIKISNDSSAVFVVVSDSGIGVPEAELPKLFEKFYQIDPEATGQVRGFGLGLFYARDFIRQHGGSISLASEPGLGTTVTIRLPLHGGGA